MKGYEKVISLYIILLCIATLNEIIGMSDYSIFVGWGYEWTTVESVLFKFVIQSWLNFIGPKSLFFFKQKPSQPYNEWLHSNRSSDHTVSNILKFSKKYTIWSKLFHFDELFITHYVLFKCHSWQLYTW